MVKGLHHPTIIQNNNSETKGENTMKVIKEYGINNKRDEYNISEAPGANMQNMVGQRIEVKAYRVTEDTDATTGEIKKLLKVIDTDGNVCGTGS